MEQVEQSILCELKSILKRAIFSISIPLISMLYPILNKYKESVTVIKTSIDNLIPFNQYFIIPYLGWYLYVAIFLALICVLNGKTYFKLLISINMGMLICFLIYSIFPTHVPRPEIFGNDIFSNLVRGLYKRDNPYNCFPSIHVLNSELVAIYVFKEEKMNSVLKIISSSIAISIILATLFIKQHYVSDAVSATILAYFLYFICNKFDFTSKLNS